MGRDKPEFLVPARPSFFTLVRKREAVNRPSDAHRAKLLNTYRDRHPVGRIVCTLFSQDPIGEETVPSRSTPRGLSLKMFRRRPPAARRRNTRCRRSAGVLRQRSQTALRWKIPFPAIGSTLTCRLLCIRTPARTWTYSVRENLPA